jgi:asparagine synthase (glutamine-hydrolysing)
VALSGDAADEFFGGYNRYLVAETFWKWAEKFPRIARQGFGAVLKSLSPSAWDALFNTLHKVIPEKYELRTPGDKAHKMARVLSARNGAQYYQSLVSHWQHPESVVIGSTEPESLLTREDRRPRGEELLHWMMSADAQTYLPDDILVKVDRAAMAHSLETRVPFLDQRLVELSWRIPSSLKIRNSETKWVLRQILYKYVPRELIDRPKMGFGVPLHDWLRGGLRDWAEDLLDERRLQREGYFDPAPIRQLWTAHLSGKVNEQHLLWDILMFQAWLSEQ